LSFPSKPKIIFRDASISCVAQELKRHNN